MHSLKNTIVAIGLLAVSFGLYHISLTPDTQLAEVPEVDILDGTELATPSTSPATHADAPVQPPARGTTPASPRLPASPPTLPAPLKAPSTTSPSTTSPSLKAPSLKTPSFNGPRPSPSASSASASSDFQPIQAQTKNGVQKIEYPPSVSSSNSNSFGDPPSVKIAQRRPLDTPGDQGLIDALKKQQAFEASHPMAAQPIAAHDSSTTQLASSVSTPDVESNAFNPSLGNNVVQANAEPDLDRLSFNAAWQKVDELVARNDHRGALQLLSRFYRDKNLNSFQRQRLMGWLDALAGKVIYSAEHHLVPQPYVVKPNESLADIGARWKVPGQLVYNINRKSIPNPMVLAPGTRLKQVPGPFQAEIDLKSHELTLYLNGLYAGRFPVRLGISGNLKPGTYRVVEKSEAGYAWRDASGKTYPVGAPENGYGPYWIGLEHGLCIHEVADSAQDGHHGCIGLNHKDAKDVFSILSRASEVKLVR